MCVKTFVRNGNLKSHMKLHTGEKPYKCSKCNMAFPLKIQLQCQLINHTGNKPFWCSLSRKYFSEKCSLTCHHKTYTGIKPYQCKQSDKKFTNMQSKILKNISKITTGHYIGDQFCSLSMNTTNDL